MRIYVDMDGVLCDFKKRFHELYGSDPELDYPKIKNSYYNNFEQIVEGGHFANLDPMPDLQEGLDFLNSLPFDTHQIFILTSTAREKYFEQLAIGKSTWLIDHDINYVPIFVPGKRFKKVYAKKGDILIDDTYSNIESWIENGGIGIWHHSWESTINSIKCYL